MTGSIRHQHIYSSGIGELIAKDIDDVMAGRSFWQHIRLIDEIAMHSYLPYTVINTLRPRQDGCFFLQTTFSNVFSWMETPEFYIKFLWNMLLRG